MAEDQQPQQRGTTLASNPSPSAEEIRETRKSMVRVGVTYGAAAFLFGVGTLMILWFIFKNDFDAASDLFTTILPVSASIVSFWFAGRSTPQSVQRSPDSG